MRTEPFKTEIQRIRENVYHVFHPSVATEEPTHTAWRTIGEKPTSSPRLAICDAMQKRPIAVLAGLVQGALGANHLVCQKSAEQKPMQFPPLGRPAEFWHVPP